MNTKDSVKQQVQKVLTQFGYKHPPVEVEMIARNQGIIIYRQPVEETFSGYILRDSSQSRTVIGVNSNHHPNRQRFTIAHELGHYYLHPPEELHVDRLMRDESSSQGVHQPEIEANQFAAELLMPETFLEEDIRRFATFHILDESVIERLAKQYRVSQQAMTIRLTRLGYLL